MKMNRSPDRFFVFAFAVFAAADAFFEKKSLTDRVFAAIVYRCVYF